jgi:hypothetical protein
VGLAVGLALCLGCGGLPDRDEQLLLLRVLSVQRGVIGPYDQELCQVSMDVEVIMPDCGIWGRHDDRVDGNTFHFDLFAAYSATACHGTSQDSTSLCLPGLHRNPPPPPLPPGTYNVVVNGVTGSFTIP